MNNLSLDNFQWLQVEISSVCQAGCIDCNRWRPRGGYHMWTPGQHTEWQLNGSHHRINSYYSIDQWQQHIVKFDRVKHLQFIGNMGDPMGHPHIVECCEIVLAHLPECCIDMSTNGGLGQIETFKKLAQLGVEITFAIDGLEDTNHIYRRGVDWHKVKERFTAFIQAGGVAQWQWVDFPHTRHQIELAKQKAIAWGFDKFDVRPRFSQDEKFDNSIIQASSQSVDMKTKHNDSVPDHVDLDNEYQYLIDNHHNNKIEPKCVNVPNGNWHHPCPHINVDGTLWPCCFTATLPFHASPVTRHWWQNQTKDFPPSWNSLEYHTPQQILESRWWSEILPDSWKNNSNLVCLDHCGKCVN